jgi:uncharacterized protein (TIGR02996 family)
MDYSTACAILRDDPEDEASRLILADWFAENGYPSYAEALQAGRIPLSPFDLEAIADYGKCQFGPGTFAKRFASSLHSRSAFGVEAASSLTPRQYRVLWDLIWSYRRQMKSKFTDACPRKKAGGERAHKRLENVAPAFVAWAHQHSA